MVNIPGGRYNHLVCGVHVAVEPFDLFVGEGFYRIDGAEDRLSKRVTVPDGLGEQFVDKVVGCIEQTFYFLEDNLFFPIDLKRKAGSSRLR